MGCLAGVAYYDTGFLLQGEWAFKPSDTGNHMQSGSKRARAGATQLIHANSLSSGNQLTMPVGPKGLNYAELPSAGKPQWMSPRKPRAKPCEGQRAARPGAQPWRKDRLWASGE